MKKKESCSFCGKTRDEVLAMVSSNIMDVFICNECISLCEEIILDNLREKALTSQEDCFVLDKKLVSLVPRDLAIAYKIVPIYYKNNYLTIAAVNSENKHEIIKILKIGNKHLIVGFVEYPYESTVINTLKKYYGNIE